MVAELVSHLKLPTIVFACKSDLERQVDRDRVSSFLEQQHDIGLVEVTTTNPSGKEKIRTAFEFVFKAIFSHRCEPVFYAAVLSVDSVSQ